MANTNLEDLYALRASIKDEVYNYFQGGEINYEDEGYLKLLEELNGLDQQLKAISEMKVFYRVGNTDTNQGLWYDYEGNFTGLIHNEFNFCKHNELPMPFDEEVVGFLSATDSLDELWNWFPKEDIKRLEEHGYMIHIYHTNDIKFYKNHWLISQENSVLHSKVRLHELEDILLLEAYMLGWNNELYGKTRLKVYDDELMQRAYDLGVVDAIIGDEVSSVDMKTNDELLTLIKDTESLGK